MKYFDLIYYGLQTWASGMGKTKPEDAVRSSLSYCLYPDAELCFPHFSGLELTCSLQCFYLLKTYYLNFCKQD